jgi:hypothetical protein
MYISVKAIPSRTHTRHQLAYMQYSAKPTSRHLAWMRMPLQGLLAVQCRSLYRKAMQTVKNLPWDQSKERTRILQLQMCFLFTQLPKKGQIISRIYKRTWSNHCENEAYILYVLWRFKLFHTLLLLSLTIGVIVHISQSSPFANLYNQSLHLFKRSLRTVFLSCFFFLLSFKF